MPKWTPSIAGAFNLGCFALILIGACKKPPTDRPDGGGSVLSTAEASSSPTLSATGSPRTAEQGTDDGYPVRWSPVLRLKSIGEIKMAIEAVDEQGFGKLSRGDETATPKTCREWSTLHGQGFEADTTLDTQADSGALVRCGTLFWLEKATPSRVSYVADIRWDATAVTILPAEMATALSSEQVSAVAEATRAGKSLKGYEPKIRAKKSDLPSRLELREGDTSMIVVDLLAWGDFDGDGNEDVVVSVNNAMTQGTYFNIRLLLLSRSRPNAVLSILRSQ